MIEIKDIEPEVMPISSVPVSGWVLAVSGGGTEYLLTKSGTKEFVWACLHMPCYCFFGNVKFSSIQEAIQHMFSTNSSKFQVYYFNDFVELLDYFNERYN